MKNNGSQEIWHPIKDKIVTRWVQDVSPKNPLPEYPRPQLRRNEWINLNGLWDYAIRPKKDNEIPKSFDGKILVPFPIESALSGVKKRLTPKNKLWYRRFFTIPESWNGKKILLHFGAIDWESTIWINGKRIGDHRGGYIPFSFEISEFINNNENELIVSVWDPTGKSCQERGKQLLRSFMIFYTPISGIWQTVWLEPISTTFITSLKITPNIDEENLNIEIMVQNPNPQDFIFIQILDKKREIVSKTIEINKSFILDIPSPNLWSPDSPFLYDLNISILRNNEQIDSIESYFGMRKISIGKDNNGIPRILLNNKEIFQYGVLDQGYWPDGLYTAPTDSALKYDIEIAKELGFNMIRKHVKIEPSRWYYHCDKIGMLVWQDMPNGGKSLFFIGKKRNKVCKKNYYKDLKSMIEILYNFPSVIVWIPFNEGWGQFETKKVVNYIKKHDLSRLIDNASGWFDKKVGDIHDIHKYVGPKCPKIENHRVAVLGEFGGLGLKINNHLWKKKKHSFSYSKLSDQNKLVIKYTELINRLKPLINKGLCAAIYTQITDVEGEINGLLTYDREIIKIDIEKLKKLNTSLYIHDKNTK
ncbi:MAG: glycoside hydrolase family 2 protein [Candidatus Helarchaeota archaeon]